MDVPLRVMTAQTSARCRPPPLAVLLLLLCAPFGASISHKQTGAAIQDGKAVCDGAVWTGATKEELHTGAKYPDVQCNREPPCVRWSWVRGCCSPSHELLSLGHQASILRGELCTAEQRIEGPES